MLALCAYLSLSHFPSRLQNCVKVCDARDLTRGSKKCDDDADDDEMKIKPARAAKLIIDSERNKRAVFL
jgi:hypothetical protein